MAFATYDGAFRQGALRRLGEFGTIASVMDGCACASLSLDSLSAPQVRNALRWLTGRRKRQRLRRMGRRDRQRVAGRTAKATGPERRSTPGRARRREAALQGDGRHRDQAMQAAFADGWPAPGQVDRAGAEWRAVRNRHAQTCNPRAASAPQPSGLRAGGWRRGATAPERNLVIVERCGRPRRRHLRKRKRGWGDAVRRFARTAHTAH